MGLALCFMTAINGKPQTLSGPFRNAYGFLIGQLRIKPTVIISKSCDIMESDVHVSGLGSRSGQFC